MGGLKARAPEGRSPMGLVGTSWNDWPRLQSLSGGTYTVQYSTNLTHWFGLTNLTLGTDLFSVIDTNSATIPRRFYRVISP